MERKRNNNWIVARERDGAAAAGAQELYWVLPDSGQ